MFKLPQLRGPAWLALAATATSLAGCSKAVVLNPAGDVASQQGHMVVQATLLMLIIIVPVIALTLWFAWKYRQSNTANTEADYDPDWHHSTTLELVIWTVPLLIIIALGALTWIGTHKLDPYRPLDRISATKPLEAQATPWWCRWSPWTGNGCSSTPSRALPPSMSWPPRWTAPFCSSSPPRPR